MAQHQIEIVQELSMSVERAFDALADHNNLSKVFGIPVERIRDGHNDVNGVGSVRALGIGSLATEETVVAMEPYVSIDYEITKNGGPLRNHHGRIDFEPTSSGSRITWTIVFDSYPVVGPATKKALETAIRRGVRNLR
jgi:hypothetical protein